MFHVYYTTNGTITTHSFLHRENLYIAPSSYLLRSAHGSIPTVVAFRLHKVQFIDRSSPMSMPRSSTVRFDTQPENFPAILSLFIFAHYLSYAQCAPVKRFRHIFHFKSELHSHKYLSVQDFTAHLRMHLVTSNR